MGDSTEEQASDSAENYSGNQSPPPTLPTPPDGANGSGAESSLSTKTYDFSFTGNGYEFFKIWIVNLALTILTLGIYSAWAKVRTNRYFYSHFQLDGEGFEYHAKPLEILKGRLIAVGLLLGYYFLGSLSLAAGALAGIAVATALSCHRCALAALSPSSLVVPQSSFPVSRPLSRCL